MGTQTSPDDRDQDFEHGSVVAQSRWLPYLLLAPVVPVLALLIIYPIISAVVVSLYRTKYLVPRPQDFAGLANYVTLLPTRSS